jgi:hypothetical protein
VLLVFGAPCQLRSLTGQEHGRTIPLADMGNLRFLRRKLIPGYSRKLPTRNVRYSITVGR